MEISRKIRKYSKKLARTNNPDKIAVYKQKLKYYRKYNQHGGGTITYPNGVYEGEEKYGKPHGNGTMIYDNRDRYIGEWKDGKKHGNGVKTWLNGNKYDGEWEDGEQHGHGVRTWSYGSKYDGEWEYGNSSGKGVSTWGEVLSTMESLNMGGNMVKELEHGPAVLNIMESGIII